MWRGMGEKDIERIGEKGCEEIWGQRVWRVMGAKGVEGDGDKRHGGRSRGV